MDCSCTPFVPVADQHRSAAKHETHYSRYAVKKDTITVRYIYTWQEKYDPVTSTIRTKPSSPASLRRSGTPEDTLYILKGYMWFVKQEPNDCDFHIEIGTRNEKDTRIVVEVTRENKEVQEKIEKELSRRHLYIKGCKHSHSGDTHFGKGISVIVRGLGFYDASHKPDTNHGDEHTRKYSWELHPVQDVIFLR